MYRSGYNSSYNKRRESSRSRSKSSGSRSSRGSRDNREKKDELAKYDNEERLEKLLKEWYKIKKEIVELNEIEDDLKELIGKIMKRKNTKELETENYRVNKKYISQQRLTKKDLPVDLWEKYAHKVEYPVYYLKRN